MFGWHRHGAPGHPGKKPHWTSGAKTGVGTSLSQHLWFTIGKGILNEIYYPRIDEAALRDMQLVVVHKNRWVSAEAEDTHCQVDLSAEGVPAYRLTNTCKQCRYRIETEIVTDPHRPVLLQRIRFVPLKGSLGDYRLYAVLAPHLGDGGAHNTAWIGEHKGVHGLFASRQGNSLPARSGGAMVLVSSAPWRDCSAGFAGRSDALTQLRRHKRLKRTYERAEDGNVVLGGEIDLHACQGECTLVLAFGHGDNEAGTHARAALKNGFAATREACEAEWKAWQEPLLPLDRVRTSDGKNCYRISTRVIRTHESTAFPGGMIASLSLPWGFIKTDKDAGGYHVAWPRDLVMAAGGYLASGGTADALRVLSYLESVQEADGHWQQCLWLDGRPFMDNIQLDETALPILLVDLASRHDELDPARYWPMVRRAATYLAATGPATPQDRWESEAGYTPFTLGACIAALLAAADLADLNGEPTLALSLCATADAWYAKIDEWTYVTGNEWCERYGVDGYYDRITPPGTVVNATKRPEYRIGNRPKREALQRADLIVSADALALVRFGLRAPDDRRILNTIKVIDDVLKVETPNGTAWRRYNMDGYGEKADGAAFDGTGIGRAWPLLAGERGHYELMAGKVEAACRARDDMEAFANGGGMISEQVWDEKDMPKRDLFRGQPTGSGCPLVWAHAEYIKLLRSLHDGAVFDLPPQTVARYLNR